MKQVRRSGSADTTRRGFLCAAGALAAEGAAALRIDETEGEKLTVLHGSRPLLEYRYDRARPKPYIHPLYLPDGTPLTLDGPKDHIHHRGLMVAWSAVNGYDFWGEVNPAPHGQIVHQRFERRDVKGAAMIVALNHWVAEGKLLLRERRTIRVVPPLREGIWLDWTSAFEAVEEVSLGPGEHVYNGLGIRVAPAMDGGQVLNSRGTSTIEKANGESATWCTYYSRTGTPSKVTGVAIFDHPSNPRHPTPFFVMNNKFGYLSAAPTFTKQAFLLPPGGKIQFRWGVLAYLGEPSRGEFDRRFDHWR